jgi:hypothetical protein
MRRRRDAARTAGDHRLLRVAPPRRRRIGFTDVTATEEPHLRTIKFFLTALPTILPKMAARWTANRDALLAYAQNEINLAQLYNAIESPAAGNWQEFTD